MAYKNRTNQRAATQAHYQRNAAVYKKRARTHSTRMRPIIRKLVTDYLVEHPCIDCGESDIVVLEFDHRDPSTKKFNVADGARRGFSSTSVKAEIEKCDVRCANCHRRKTHRERLAGKYQSEKFDELESPLPLFD